MKINVTFMINYHERTGIRLLKMVFRMELHVNMESLKVRFILSVIHKRNNCKNVCVCVF